MNAQSVAEWFQKCIDDVDIDRYDDWWITGMKLIVVSMLLVLLVITLFFVGLYRVVDVLISAAVRLVSKLDLQLKQRRVNKQAQRDFEAFCRETMNAKRDIDAIFSQALVGMDDQQRKDLIERWGL